MDIRPVYCLSPGWPTLTMTDHNWQDVIDRLETFLTKRISNREHMLQQVEETGTVGVVVVLTAW